MEKRKALTEHLSLVISFDPQSLFGVEGPETNLKFA
jgi:hypothetical protein